MKVRLFVSSSAIALAIWLGITYVREVPQRSYPSLGRGSVPVSAAADPAVPPAAVIALDGDPAEPLAELAE